MDNKNCCYFARLKNHRGFTFFFFCFAFFFFNDSIFDRPDVPKQYTTAGFNSAMGVVVKDGFGDLKINEVICVGSYGSLY